VSTTIELALPEELRAILGARAHTEEQVERWAIEGIILEAYRERLLSRGKVGDLLGLAFHEREAFLQSRGVPYNYDSEDLETDGQSLNRILGP